MGLVNVPTLSLVDIQKESYDIDYDVQSDAEDLEIILLMGINGYVSSNKFDLPEQACSYLYNGH